MSDVYLVGVDGSEAGERAAMFAAEQAKATGAELLLVHVIDWSRYEVLTPREAAERHKTREEELARAQELIMAPLLEKLSASGVGTSVAIEHGHPAAVMADLAKQKNACQIIVGRHGHTRLGAALFGSVAFAVGQTAPVPVTIIP